MAKSDDSEPQQASAHFALECAKLQLLFHSYATSSAQKKAPPVNGRALCDSIVPSARGKPGA